MLWIFSESKLFWKMFIRNQLVLDQGSGTCSSVVSVLRLRQASKHEV